MFAHPKMNELCDLVSRKVNGGVLPITAVKQGFTATLWKGGKRQLFHVYLGENEKKLFVCAPKPLMLRSLVNPTFHPTDEADLNLRGTIFKARQITATRILLDGSGLAAPSETLREYVLFTAFTIDQPDVLDKVAFILNHLIDIADDVDNAREEAYYPDVLDLTTAAYNNNDDHSLQPVLHSGYTTESDSDSDA